MKSYKVVVLTFLLCCLLTTVLRITTVENKVKPFKPPQMKRQPLEKSKTCPGCKGQIDKVMKAYSTSWEKSEKNNAEFRNLLHKKCNGSNSAIICQDKYPRGSKINKIPVAGDLANILPLRSPFFNKTWDTCSVVGNGGILFDSHCGAKIDSADFVFRCNLPPLDKFKKHVGNKSGLVTANRSILRLNTKSNPKPLLQRVSQYGDAMILISDLSSAILAHTVKPLKQLKSPFRPVFLNHQYLQKLKTFWSSKGVKERFVTSGLIIISLALEVCKTVNVYGFWPFGRHPFGLYYLSHHYYDNDPPKPGVHNMPVEFEKLVELHRKGILRLHLNNC